MGVEDDHPPEIGLEEARQPTLTDFNNKSGLSREVEHSDFLDG